MNGGLSARGLAGAYARGRSEVRDQIEDRRRAEFLTRLDNADFEVTDNEAAFIESVLPLKIFTPDQRKFIYDLRHKYLLRLTRAARAQ